MQQLIQHQQQSLMHQHQRQNSFVERDFKMKLQVLDAKGTSVKEISVNDAI